MAISPARFLRRFMPGGDPNNLAVIVGSDDQALPSPEKTSERGGDPSNDLTGVGLFGHDLEDDRDRVGAYRDYRLLDSNVPELSRSLSVIASNATSGDQLSDRGFEIEFAPDLDEQSRAIVNDLLIERLAMPTKIAQDIRAWNKFGDEFLQLVYDKRGVIWRLRWLEPELTKRCHDAYDRHVGFTYRGFADQERDLEWWEVIHNRHDPEAGRRYGRSLFAGGGRTLGHRVLTIRDALTFETLVHSTARNAIFLPRRLGMSEQQARTWLARIRDRFARERMVGTDGILSRRAISMLNSQHVVVDFPVDNEGRGARPEIKPLQNAPVEKNVFVASHFQDLLFVLTGVPKAFLGIEREADGLGSTRLNTQDIQFARQVNGEQLNAIDFVMEVVRRQFILLGRPLPADSVRIIMPDLREFDAKMNAEVWLAKMNAAKVAAEVGMPESFIWQELVWEGDEQVAQEKSELHRLAFDTDTVTPQTRRFNVPQAGAEESIAQMLRVREMAKAMRGQQGGNRAVTQQHIDQAKGNGVPAGHAR